MTASATISPQQLATAKATLNAGLANATDITFSSDTDATGSGDLIFQTNGGKERMRMSSSGVLTMSAPDGVSTMLQFEDIAASSGKYAGVVLFSGSAGSWGMGIDVAAATPCRDMVLAFKRDYPNPGQVNDFIYCSHNGTDPPTIGLGLGQPDANFRVQIISDSTNKPSQGSLRIIEALGQTGDLLAITTGGKTKQFGVASDFSVIAKSNPVNRTVSDGVTSTNTTITSATAAFTSDDLGRYITGAGIPAGTYISAVGSATSITVSQATTATATSVSLTIVVPYFNVIANSNAPMFMVHTGSGAGATSHLANVNGFGPGVAATPTATVDIAQLGASNATFKLRTASNGSLAITALGASAEVDLWTANASILKLGTNATQAIKISTAQSVMIGASGIATSATDGFAYITSTAGSPTGVPTTQAGYSAIHYDTTNHKFWVYDGGWKGVVVA